MDRCPKCSGEGLPILYGNPTMESFKMLERGELVLGGCCIEDGLPTHACRACEHRWGHLSMTNPGDLASPFDGLDDEEETVVSHKGRIFFTTCPSCYSPGWHPLHGAPIEAGRECYECDFCGHADTRPAGDGWVEVPAHQGDVPFDIR